MKTRIKIMTMLIAMMIGTLAASAQSARRGSSEQKRTTSTSKTYKKPTQQSNKTTARKTQSSRQTQTAQRVNTQQRTTHPQRGNATHTQRNNSQRMSTSNHKNPRSDYRAPNKTVHVGKTYVDPKPVKRYNKQQAYNNNKRLTHRVNNVTTHHKHQYYPARKVKIHIHPMTYRGNYRALYYPRYSEIIWTRSMHRHYVALYPRYTGWHYNWGYRIQTMSVFDARYNVGEMARVYGRVYATWYNQETDDLLLFFGGEYPNQEFTMIVPGNVARRFSWRPERYFLGQHVAATGLITAFEGEAEMLLKKKSQISVY